RPTGEWKRPAPAVAAEQIPPRKRKLGQILNWGARYASREELASRQLLNRTFGFANNHEVAAGLAEFREFGGGQPDTPDPDSTRALLLRPGALAAVVDERREHDRHIPFGCSSFAVNDLVSGGRANGRDVPELHARKRMELLLEGGYHPCHAR